MAFPVAIQGWKVTYHAPTGNYSGVFVVTTHAQLAKDKEWLDEGGFSYRIEEIAKGSAMPVSRSWWN